MKKLILLPLFSISILHATNAQCGEAAVIGSTTVLIQGIDEPTTYFSPGDQVRITHNGQTAIYHPGPSGLATNTILLFYSSGPVFNVGEYINGSIHNVTTGNNCSYHGRALPVNLAYFRGQDNGDSQVRLTWATESEQNNSHFEIYQSLDGVNFSMIGTVPGHGNSNERREYSITSQFNKELSYIYFQLFQEDYDGTRSNEGIIRVNRNTTLNSFEVYPNPSQSELFIAGNAFIREQDIHLMNSRGQILEKINLVDGQPLKIDHLPKGQYFLILKEEKVRFIKN